MKIRIVVENVILSIRHIAGPMALFLFVFMGAIRGADIPVLFFGGIIAYAVAFMLGSVAAIILERMNREIRIEPIAEEPDHETAIKHHLDIQQGMELPTPH